MFPLSLAFHSQLTASNENDENIEPVITTPLLVNNTVESTPLTDAESRSTIQIIEQNCNSKGNLDHLVNEIGPYPFAPPPGFIWKPKWELSPADGISGAQTSELLNSKPQRYHIAIRVLKSCFSIKLSRQQPRTDPKHVT